MNISGILKEELRHLGADLVGIGDITMLPAEARKNMSYGIAVAVAINPDVIREIGHGPTWEYYCAYEDLNIKLDKIVTAGASFIQNHGYDAIAQTASEVAKTETEYGTVLPHKTVATRAGIGWIGKNAMLITKEFGSAVRISAILTNACLEADNPVNEPNCKDCKLCKEACPGEAILGLNWNISSNREVLFDAAKCKRMARKVTKERLNIEKTLCGKCVYVCPYTQLYLKKQ